MRIVKGPEDYAETPSMKKIADLYESIREMEFVYEDDLKKIISEFEDIAHDYPYYVMPIGGSLDKISQMETKDLWDEFKGYLDYCYDRMNPGRVVYLGNILCELETRLREKR